MTRILVFSGGSDSTLGGRLRRCGFDVDLDQSQRVETHIIESAALVIIEVATDELDSVERLRQIRSISSVPIIVHASSDDATECVVALEHGADDYVRASVTEFELIARIKSLLRRSEISTTRNGSDVLVAGDLSLNASARLVTQFDKSVNLTPVEFELLRVLLSSMGTLVPREAISREVFGGHLSSRNRAIDVHMSGLRKKLGPSPDGGDRIRTVRGYGYIYTKSQP